MITMKIIIMITFSYLADDNVLFDRVSAGCMKVIILHLKQMYVNLRKCKYLYWKTRQKYV